MSDDEWDTAADDVGTLTLGDDEPVVNAWEGEDEDEDALLDGDADWDDDKPKPVAAPTVQPKPKKLTKKKILEKQAKMEEEARRRAAAMSAADAAQAKADAQRRVEEADNELTEELFMGAGGGDDEDDGDRVAAKAATITNVVDALTVDTDAEFQELGKAIASKVEVGDPVQIKLFLDTVMKQVCATFRLDDINDVKKTITVIYNDVRQAEVGKKKKGGKKKKFVNTGSRNDEFDQMSSAQYDDPDDFDFL